ncbi:MAG: YraN family protein [Desulfovibrio sp.]|jgi:putative endonuclease|nr:YraN family protein [Desulfovibrio sp.]
MRTEQNAHLALGRAGEDAAASLLLRQGFRILHRNWRPSGALRGLELDLVAELEDLLLFVEVKTRSRVRTPADGARQAFCGKKPAFSGPDRDALQKEGIPLYAAFTPGKRDKFVRAARLYLSAHALWGRPCRFDLILVGRNAQGHLYPEQHTNVIELRHLVGGGNAAWQPW